MEPVLSNCSSTTTSTSTSTCISTGTSTRFCDPQVKYALEIKTAKEEASHDTDKFLLLMFQSGNSQGIKYMDTHKETSQVHLVMKKNSQLFFMVPPMRPLSANIPIAWMGSTTPEERSWSIKNLICDNAGDPAKWGSGVYHDMSKKVPGVHVPGFAQAVLSSTRTNTNTSTSTSY